ISTSLPFDVQYQFVRSMQGFEQAEIVRPGYAIEYDFFDPRDLKTSLETKYMPGLFFAGQINGTTGYEEAAAQGLIAGLNAARKAQDKEAWCPARNEAYIGVMIDDLIANGTTEPYRMFTSRAEYRLLLREDNADLRLTEKGRELGLVNEQQWQFFNVKQDSITQLQNKLKATWVRKDSPEAQQVAEVWGKPLSKEASLMDLLRRPEVDIVQLMNFTGEVDVDSQVAQQVEIQAKYAGYIERQQQDIDKAKRYDHLKIPGDLDFNLVKGLSNEVREKFIQQRPETLGLASRIPGVTPAAISLLLIYMKKKNG
ncbi:MAG: tRNA uridine-5-carboxymethylaminomethyl(34) synthesis enzyme MnmG, partial [Methyloprofundus sp.]|nr:tRNA uridine-5-carboxymethylaminomethyl(34) synthesis enzyme MnmG [Methyloprofundus sp.]